ncbi:hypothetical protein [Escherichia coli ISC7]|uniref:Uncharacterized protein n=1 Tax=Escherichia coli ISC7 TaxID=1432555 RepID=W1EYH8_ECOLX|nr:hypothetical protein [Escherichia coli ISC7]
MRKYPLSLLKDKNIVTFLISGEKPDAARKTGATTITFFAGIRWM